MNAPHDSGAEASRARSLVLLAALGVFFAADDQTSVVTVLPEMIEGIGLPQDEFYRAAWIVNAYILGYVVAMPLVGRVSDALGHGRVFAASMAVFVLGSLAVALSPDLTTVSIARAVQAVGAGAVVPVSMAIVVDYVSYERRALGLGAMPLSLVGVALAVLELPIAGDRRRLQVVQDVGPIAWFHMHRNPSDVAANLGHLGDECARGQVLGEVRNVLHRNGE